MPTPLLEPATDSEAAALILDARAKGQTLDIVGGGTRLGLGRPPSAPTRLSTRKLSGIVFHEPSEMILRARAGAPLKDIEAALAAHGQMLPFEPMDPRPLYGSEGEPTVGGLVAANVSGPRRVSAGAGRDSCIGLKLINGLGQIINAGGRVTKNVTGLDLTKFACGAYGTLGLVTEATFKLLPRPEAEATVIMRRLDPAQAVAAMTRALGSPFGVSGAGWFNAGMGREWTRAFVRVEGFQDSVAHRAGMLVAALAEFNAKGFLQGGDSSKLWRAVRDASYLAEPRDRAVWRIVLRPSRAPGLLAALGGFAQDAFMDWGGALLWLSAPPTQEACATIRAASAAHGGAATLMRAPDALRSSVDVFEPLSAPLARLTRDAKASFDPDGVFNPGRMGAI